MTTARTTRTWSRGQCRFRLSIPHLDAPSDATGEVEQKQLRPPVRRLPATSPRHKGSADRSWSRCPSSLLPNHRNRRRNGGEGGRSGPTVPPMKAGRTRLGRNEEKDSGAAGVAARRGGTTGKRRPPRQFACRRHAAIALARCPQTGAKLRRTSCDRHPDGPRRRKGDSATRGRRRARSRRRRETPWDCDLKSHLYARVSFFGRCGALCGATRTCLPCAPRQSQSCSQATKATQTGSCMTNTPDRILRISAVLVRRALRRPPGRSPRMPARIARMS